MEDGYVPRRGRAESFWLSKDAKDACEALHGQEEPADNGRVRICNDETARLEEPRVPLGMNSFDRQQHDEFGQRVRIAIALMDGSVLSSSGESSG
jgi:hypothetical protein